MFDLKEVLTRNFLDINPEYEMFAQEKNCCRRCEIHDHYNRVAQSEGGTSNPTFMFIGEAYGKDEADQVRPFIGRAGQRLREELRKHRETFNRRNTIMSNVLSCRPKDNKFPEKGKATSPQNDLGEVFDKYLKSRAQSCYKIFRDNSRTQPDETVDVALFCAQQWLFREIELLQPKIIVTLGAVPLRYVCGEYKITEKRGEWMFLPRFRAWAFPTFHPSYVLRCNNDPQKSYVVHYFEQDIARVAETWQTVVSNDYRMRMSVEDWKRHSALLTVRSKMSHVFGKVST